MHTLFVSTRDEFEGERELLWRERVAVSLESIATTLELLLDLLKERLPARKGARR